MQPHPVSGRDPTDDRTVDLESWLAFERLRRADRLRAAFPELAMVQLPLDLHERRARQIRTAGGW